MDLDPSAFGDESPQWAGPGRFFAPAYPILVHLVQQLDPRLASAIRCQVRYPEETPKPGGACPGTFATLVALQVLLWAITALAVFHMALLLARNETVAWLAMVIALASGEPGYYARTYLSENATVPAFCLFMLFAMRAVEGRRTRDFAYAGLAMGVAALARPAYAYLFYLLVPLMALAAVLLKRRRDVPSLQQTGLFAVVTLAVLAPWMLRNLVQFGSTTLSAGYAELILMQRVSYNQMSWAEWWVAWIYWLPDFGDDVARLLFPPELWERLGWSHPQNYYVDGGEGRFRETILAAVPNDADVLPLLMKTYLLGDLGKHVVVTLPLTLRGLGVAKYLSVAGWVLLWPVLRRMQAEGRLAPFLALLLPPLLMAGLHGFVSVNIERYNIPMVAVYAVVIAVSVVSTIERRRAARV